MFYLGLGHGAFLASSRNEFGRSGNNAPVEMMGLEEQIEREEGSEERMDEKRSRIQATRSAVREALVLWSSKASLLQVDRYKETEGLHRPRRRHTERFPRQKFGLV